MSRCPSTVAPTRGSAVAAAQNVLRAVVRGRHVEPHGDTPSAEDGTGRAPRTVALCMHEPPHDRHPHGSRRPCAVWRQGARAGVTTVPL